MFLFMNEWKKQIHLEQIHLEQQLETHYSCDKNVFNTVKWSSHENRISAELQAFLLLVK